MSTTQALQWNASYLAPTIAVSVLAIAFYRVSRIVTAMPNVPSAKVTAASIITTPLPKETPSTATGNLCNYAHQHARAHLEHFTGAAFVRRLHAPFPAQHFLAESSQDWPFAEQPACKYVASSIFDPPYGGHQEEPRVS